MNATSPRLRLIGIAVLTVWTLLPRLWLSSVEPNHLRDWDERYSVRNLALILQEGPTRIDNASYPGMSFLLHLPPLAICHWLSSSLERADLAIVNDSGGPRMERRGRADGLNFTRLGYRVVRCVNSLFGLLSVILCFAIVRRSLGDAWGLASAFALASIPWHIHMSSVFKPDIVLLASILAAILLTLRALSRGGYRDFAIAGGAVGVALSAKYNALPIAIPFAAAALLTPDTTRSQFAHRVLLGGGAAVAIFVVLNPWMLGEPEIYFNDFSRTLDHYELQDRQPGASRLAVLMSFLPSLADPGYHGPLVVFFAVVGTALAAASLLRQRSKSELYPDGLIALTFGVAYVVSYSLASSHVAATHNWLPVTWVTAFLAAVAGRRLLRTAPSIPATLGVCLALGAFVALPAAGFVYRQAVPHLLTGAIRDMRSSWGGPAGRVIVSEIELPPTTWKTRFATIIRNEHLGELPDPRLMMADAEIYLAHGTSRERWQQRAANMPAEQVLAIEPKLLRQRGEPVRILFHPLRRGGRPYPLVMERSEDGSFVATLQPPPRAHSVSLELAATTGSVATASIGRTPRPLHPSQRFVDDTWRMATERVRLRRGRTEIRIVFETQSPDELTVEVIYWRRPETPG
ncbi:MAG: glycosyltransferase family 39 protein [Acidobacteriota bacterium]|nr:glycosyltransferase family 39 protein [Acidobacteriota bacterium]